MKTVMNRTRAILISVAISATIVTFTLPWIPMYYRRYEDKSYDQVFETCFQPSASTTATAILAGLCFIALVLSERNKPKVKS